MADGLRRSGLVPTELSGHELRQKICEGYELFRGTLIQGKSIEDWILAETGQTLAAYLKGLKGSSWGGLIDFVICSLMYAVSFEILSLLDAGAKYWLQSVAFVAHADPKTVISVLFNNKHYDSVYVDASSKLPLGEAQQQIGGFVGPKKFRSLSTNEKLAHEERKLKAQVAAEEVQRDAHAIEATLAKSATEEAQEARYWAESQLEAQQLATEAEELMLVLLVSLQEV